VSLPEVVARYGGDEFVLLLPESDRTAAVELTSAIVDKLDALSVFEADTKERHPLSTSLAIVSYPEDGSSREELLAAAELALEQEKAERKVRRDPVKPMTAVQQLRMTGRRQSA